VFAARAWLVGVAATPAVGSPPAEQADKIRITATIRIATVRAKDEILIIFLLIPSKKFLSASVFAVSIPASFSDRYP
jgi:hypothetical protein